MLRDFAIWLFFEDNKPGAMPVGGFFHILYNILIFGSVIGLGFLFSKKSEKFKDNVLKIIAYGITFLYISDFFVHPLMEGDTAKEAFMITDKLPFHICTVMCPLIILFYQFKQPKFAREALAFLAMVGSTMYITYPGSAIGSDVSPICYRVLQTFLYHGFVFAWGYYMIVLKKVKPSIKRCWQPIVGLCCLACWATFGRLLYAVGDSTYDWMFLLRASGIFGDPKPYTFLLTLGSISAVILMLYGIYYAVIGIMKLIEKAKSKKETAKV